MKPMPTRANVLLWLSLALVVCLTATPAKAPAQAAADQVPDGPTKLLRYADISKDKVVFAYAGDLWIAARDGGNARRLTSHVGDELFPKFSPDGKWIAFTGEYDGNPDVYVISAEGGEPKRLTFHPSNDIVLGWTPDGKNILFRSDRFSAPPGRFTKLFLVSPQGGTAKQLQIPRGDLTSFSPDGTKVAYIETSQEFRTWKRYRGGWNLPIAIYDLKKNTYEELPKSTGMEMFPMWHGNAIYFISDRDGVMNLYSYDLGSKQTKKLTDYKEYDIKWPSLGPDAIVYENGGSLFEYTIASGKTRNLPIVVRGEDIEARAEFKSVAPNIGSFAISPSAARAVMEARGNIFTVPAEHGSIRTLTTEHSSIHELNPAWSPDGKWIAYLSDKTGEYELYTRPQMGGEETRITADGGVYRYGPTWSPDSKNLLYWDKLHKLWYVSVEDKKPVLVDEAGYGDITDASWSPDSLWLTYSKPHRRGSNDISLYSLASKKVTKVSAGFYNDTNPVFDPAGKYLYFISSRYFYPSIGQLDQRYNYYTTDGVFALTLKADEASPFKPESDEEKAADEKKEKDDKKDDKAKKDEKKAADAKSDEQKEEKKDEKKAEKKPEPVKPIEIDLDGIGSRIAHVPVAPGILSISRRARTNSSTSPAAGVAAIRDAHAHGPTNTLHVFDIAKREDKLLLDGIDDYDLDKDGGKVIYKSGKIFGITDAAPGKAKVGEGKLETRRTPDAGGSARGMERDFRGGVANRAGFLLGSGDGRARLEKNRRSLRGAAAVGGASQRFELHHRRNDLRVEHVAHVRPGRRSAGSAPRQCRHARRRLRCGQGFYRFKKIYRGEDWNPTNALAAGRAGLENQGRQITWWR